MARTFSASGDTCASVRNSCSSLFAAAIQVAFTSLRVVGKPCEDCGTPHVVESLHSGRWICGRCLDVDNAEYVCQVAGGPTRDPDARMGGVVAVGSRCHCGKDATAVVCTEVWGDEDLCRPHAEEWLAQLHGGQHAVEHGELCPDCIADADAIDSP